MTSGSAPTHLSAGDRMTRWLPALMLCLAVGGTACTKDDNPTDPGPQTGTLVFKLDAASCTGQGTLELFVDGTSQGQWVFNAGDYKAFTVSAGTHSVAANEIGGAG